MKLATFTHANRTRIGVADGDEIVDLSAAAPDLPQDMVGFLEAGKKGLDGARNAISAKSARIPLAEVKLEAPVTHPPEFLAVGLNYGDHIAETGMKTPEFPVFFNKQVTCVNAPNDPIHMPRVSTALDFEGELAFVIGRAARHVPKERAAEYIAGYTIVDDVSVRDWQFKAQTMTMGKSFDTHGPMGPFLVTPDEVGDPHALDLKTWVNGELRQDSNTRHLVFDCFDQVETLSKAMTLRPGTVVTTGTPGGVGIAAKPPRLLKVGDRVRIAITNLGEIEHEVVPEPGS